VGCFPRAALFLGLLSLPVGLFALCVGFLALPVGLLLGAFGFFALAVGLFLLLVGLLTLTVGHFLGIGSLALGVLPGRDLHFHLLLLLFGAVVGGLEQAFRFRQLVDDSRIIAQFLVRPQVPAGDAVVAQADHQPEQGNVEAIPVVGLDLGV